MSFFRVHSVKLQDLMHRFPHLPEKIFQKLDSKNLFKSREVERTWKNTIDGRDYAWLRIVNIPTILKKRNSYLHLAAETGQIEAFKTSLKQEEDENIKNERGETPFFLACKNGHFRIVQFLLKNTDLKIDCNAKAKWRCVTAFHMACQLGHLDVVKILLENATALGIDVNARAGCTAFHSACTNGHSDVVKILMKNATALSIDLNEKDYCGVAPFLHGCNHAKTDVVKIFMKNAANLGIDLNAKSSRLNDWTGLHMACKKGFKNVVKIIMENAATLNIDLGIRDRSGYTAFDLAVQRNQSDISKIFMENAWNQNM